MTCEYCVELDEKFNKLFADYERLSSDYLRLLETLSELQRQVKLFGGAH